MAAGVVLQQRAGKHHRRHRVRDARADQLTRKRTFRQIDHVEQICGLERQPRSRVHPAAAQTDRRLVAAVERSTIHREIAAQFPALSQVHLHVHVVVTIVGHRQRDAGSEHPGARVKHLLAADGVEGHHLFASGDSRAAVFEENRPGRGIAGDSVHQRVAKPERALLGQVELAEPDLVERALPASELASEVAHHAARSV